MLWDFSTVQREDEDSFTAVHKTEKTRAIEFKQEYPIELWDSPEAFSHAGIRGYEPMTAKELDTPEKQDEAFNNPDNYIEEKFDGTRGIMQFLNYHTAEGEYHGYARIFSRRISKKTGFYVENSDSLPQLKVTDCEELRDTVIDGEMFINGRPFKDVSSTLNCLWDKAIERQIEKGFVTLHAFDIIKYKGIDLRRMKLEKRKEFLKRVILQADNEYIQEVEYYQCGDVLRYATGKKQVVSFSAMLKRRGIDTLNLGEMSEVYKALAEAQKTDIMTPKAYYELIIATGGEGVIIKPKDGQYHHKRGWEYSKIKKFLTRELILMYFDEPTREYAGKAPKNWAYYEGDTPVTRHYYNKQVGNLVLGVVINKSDYAAIPVNKRGKVYSCGDIIPSLKDNHNALDYYIMEVCECGGFDDNIREYFTRNRKRLVGSVVEVRANEIMRDSGRLRHPRYERMRVDKEPERCTWTDHIA